MLKHLISGRSDRSHTGNPLETSALRVVSSSHPDIASGPTDLSDLLDTVCTVGGSRTLVQVDSRETYIVWAASVVEASLWTAEEGLAHAVKFFRDRRSSSTTFLYPAVHDTEKTVLSYLIAILDLHSETSQSVAISLQDRHAVDELGSSPNVRSSWSNRASSILRRKSCLFLLAGLTLAMLLSLMLLDTRGKDQADQWLHWETKGSDGPRHQLQFTRPWLNFSEWATQTHHEDTDWFVRIDDQSMVPSHLIDETELKYQRWFANRYPDVEAIRASGDYLNSSFYEHPTRHEIRSDRFFHPAHCVLALRRYWMAKETGKHVCPRDLDFKHIRHCFDILDEFAFVGGRQGEEPVLQEEDTTLPWLVNACF